MLSLISNIKLNNYNLSTRRQGYGKFKYYFSDVSDVFLESIYFQVSMMKQLRLKVLR